MCINNYLILLEFLFNFFSYIFFVFFSFDIFFSPHFLFLERKEGLKKCSERKGIEKNIMESIYIDNETVFVVDK